MKFRPSHYRVVNRLDAEEKLPGGIIIPDKSRRRGEVVAVGPLAPETRAAN